MDGWMDESSCRHAPKGRGGAWRESSAVEAGWGCGKAGLLAEVNVGRRVDLLDKVHTFERPITDSRTQTTWRN